MIYRLQKRFIIICTVSVLSVAALVFFAILALNFSSMNRNLDVLADTVSAGGGRFPASFGGGPKPDDKPPAERESGFINPETPFATRHFTVFFDVDGNVERTHTEAIAAIDAEAAVEYAQTVLESGGSRGWVDNYRYKLFGTEQGSGVVFIDGSMSRSSHLQSVTIAGFVLLGCAATVLILIFLLSGKAVKPIAESYEKQKQFITDANHELKTPLTLILANLDIAEAELGENEWLEDIRTEGHRMTELVNQLVSLSRMDEDGKTLCVSELDFSGIVSEAAEEFTPLSESRGKRLVTDIASDVTYSGDEELLRRLLSVLLDNAVKYCDEGGEIRVALEKRRRTVLTVENTYSAVGETELSRLFDRFYRADKARSYAGGYGVGLSMAKAIVEKHKGDISAYSKNGDIIGFKVIL